MALSPLIMRLGAWGSMVVLGAASLSACATVIEGTPQIAATPGQCAATGEDSTRWISPRQIAPSAPNVRVPALAGWVNWKTPDKDTVLFLRNPSLSVDGLTPGVTVMVADVSVARNDAEGNLDDFIKGVSEASARKSATFTQERTLVCGYPARKVVANQPMPGGKSLQTISLATVVTEGVGAYLVVLTVLSGQPDDPTYKADSNIFLSQWQVRAGVGK